MYHCLLLAHLFIDAVTLLEYLSYTVHQFPCLVMCSNNNLASIYNIQMFHVRFGYVALLNQGLVVKFAAF